MLFLMFFCFEYCLSICGSIKYMYNSSYVFCFSLFWLLTSILCFPRLISLSNSTSTKSSRKWKVYIWITNSRARIKLNAYDISTTYLILTYYIVTYVIAYLIVICQCNNKKIQFLYTHMLRVESFIVNIV